MLKNAFWLFTVAAILLVVFLPSYTKMQDLRQRNADYAQQMQHLKEENKYLTEEKRRLEKDPVYLEKVAREKMGIVRDGEVVYKITPVQQNKVVTPKQR
ncbi:MAG: septum formation initiator family protein [Candidatus Omnitrophota bacterium]